MIVANRSSQGALKNFVKAMFRKQKNNENIVFIILLLHNFWKIGIHKTFFRTFIFNIIFTINVSSHFKNFRIKFERIFLRVCKKFV